MHNQPHKNEEERQILYEEREMSGAATKQQQQQHKKANENNSCMNKMHQKHYATQTATERMEFKMDVAHTHTHPKHGKNAIVSNNKYFKCSTIIWRFFKFFSLFSHHFSTLNANTYFHHCNWIDRLCRLCCTITPIVKTFMFLLK